MRPSSSPVVLLCALAALFAGAAALPGLLELGALASADALLIDGDRSGLPAVTIVVDATLALLSAGAAILAGAIALDAVAGRR